MLDKLLTAPSFLVHCRLSLASPHLKLEPHSMRAAVLLAALALLQLAAPATAAAPMHLSASRHLLAAAADSKAEQLPVFQLRQRQRQPLSVRAQAVLDTGAAAAQPLRVVPLQLTQHHSQRQPLAARRLLATKSKPTPKKKKAPNQNRVPTQKASNLAAIGKAPTKKKRAPTKKAPTPTAKKPAAANTEGRQVTTAPTRRPPPPPGKTGAAPTQPTAPAMRTFSPMEIPTDQPEGR